MRKLTIRERGEIESREFHGEETWLKWKKHYDELMSYRKSLKGKPTEEQLFYIQTNKTLIDWYEGTLFHSSFYAISGQCTCAGCKRKKERDEFARHKLLEDPQYPLYLELKNKFKSL